MGATTVTTSSSPYSSQGGSARRRESSLIISTLPSSTRTLSHPNESSPVQWPTHRNSHQNSLVTTATLNHHYVKGPNSPRSPRTPKSATFTPSPNATPTSKTSSTFQIISNALDAVVNLPYKLGDNLSAKSEPWSPNERKRQAAARSTVYYSPETGPNDLQIPKFPSRQSSNFDFNNVKTQPVVVVYNPYTSTFKTVSANAEQPVGLGQLLAIPFSVSFPIVLLQNMSSLCQGPLQRRMPELLPFSHSPSPSRRSNVPKLWLASFDRKTPLINNF